MTPDDQHLAAVFLLRFYMNRTGAAYSDVARDAGIPEGKVNRKDVGMTVDAGKHVGNFHSTFQSQHFEKIRRFLIGKIESDPVFERRSAVVDELIDVLRGLPLHRAPTERAMSFDRLLSPVVEEGDAWKQRLLAVYGSAWHVIRFAVGVGPGMDWRKNKNDPWMVYAIMNIQPPEPNQIDGFPVFEIFYKALRDQDDSFRPINGNICSLREGPYMIFVGVEEGTKWPLILAADQQKDIKARPRSFKSLTLRKFESGSFIAGYSLFLRSKIPWKELIAHERLGNVGIFKRSQIVKRLRGSEQEIGDLIDGLRNIADNNGRSMLSL